MLRLFGSRVDRATAQAADRRSTTSWRARRVLAVLSWCDAQQLVKRGGTDTPGWPVHGSLARLAAADHAKTDYTGAMSAIGCALSSGEMPSAAVVRTADMAARRSASTLSMYVTNSSSCPPAALAALARIGAGGDPPPDWSTGQMGAWARAEVAGHHNCPSSVVSALVAVGGYDCRLSAASNPATPPKALDMLLSGDDPYTLKIAALRNQSCGSDTLDCAARAMKATFRRVVASHPNTATSTLRLFAEDPDPTVRSRTARHPRCAEPTLRQLAADTDPKVRKAAAMALKRRSRHKR